ncbi:hypothetical protein [Streptomyces sp. NPDC006334]|uniref:hypothetical protein n=1 Tax=Streptomyces sp. NPDC006334 TaxID=3156754 RepID=UPI0033ABBD79
MLNAAEASMDMAAEDDAERQRNRARLYAPPKGANRRPAGGGRPRGAARVDASQARALMAQTAAEDARLQGRG